MKLILALSLNLVSIGSYAQTFFPEEISCLATLEDEAITMVGLEEKGYVIAGCDYEAAGYSFSCQLNQDQGERPPNVSGQLTLSIIEQCNAVSKRQ